MLFIFCFYIILCVCLCLHMHMCAHTLTCASVYAEFKGQPEPLLSFLPFRPSGLASVFSSYSLFAALQSYSLIFKRPLFQNHNSVVNNISNKQTNKTWQFCLLFHIEHWIWLSFQCRCISVLFAFHFIRGQRRNVITCTIYFYNLTNA